MSDEVDLSCEELERKLRYGIPAVLANGPAGSARSNVTSFFGEPFPDDPILAAVFRRILRSERTQHGVAENAWHLHSPILVSDEEQAAILRCLHPPAELLD